MYRWFIIIGLLLGAQLEASYKSDYKRLKREYEELQQLYTNLQNDMDFVLDTIPYMRDKCNLSDKNVEELQKFIYNMKQQMIGIEKQLSAMNAKIEEYRTDLGFLAHGKGGAPWLLE